MQMYGNVEENANEQTDREFHSTCVFVFISLLLPRRARREPLLDAAGLGRSLSTSELRVVHLVQPRRRAGGEVWVAAAAARRQVGAGPVGPAHQPAPLSHARGPDLAHHGEAGVGVDEARDEGLVAGEGLQGVGRLGQAVGAARADVVVGLLGLDDGVLQGEGGVRARRAAHGRRRLAQAAIQPVGVAQVRHGRLVCRRQRRGKTWFIG